MSEEEKTHTIYITTKVEAKYVEDLLWLKKEDIMNHRIQNTFFSEDEKHTFSLEGTVAEFEIINHTKEQADD